MIFDTSYGKTCNLIIFLQVIKVTRGINCSIHTEVHSKRKRSGQRSIIKFLCRQDLTRDVPSQAPDGGQNSSFFHPARRRGRIRKPAVIVRANLDDDADDDAFPLPTTQRVKFSYLSSPFLNQTWWNSREEDEN